MKKPELSIIIVTYNSEKWIKLCIESIKKQHYKKFEIILIDNNSQDQTKKIIKNYNFIKFIENENNLGFAKANNQGIELAKGKYVFLLNPDAILSGDCITVLVNFFEKEPNAAFVSPKLLKLWDKKFLDSTGIIATPDRTFYDRGIGEIDRKQYDQNSSILAGCGAALLFRKEALDDVNLFDEYFDEDFLNYFEDLDLCWRMRLRGWNGYYCPSAVVYHARGHDLKRYTGKSIIPFIKQRIQSSKKIKHFKHIRRCLFRNSYWTLIKNDSFYELLSHFPSIVCSQAKKLGYSMLFQPYVFIEIPTLFLKLPLMLRKRNIIQRTKKIDHTNLRRFFKDEASISS